MSSQIKGRAEPSTAFPRGISRSLAGSVWTAPTIHGRDGAISEFGHFNPDQGIIESVLQSASLLVRAHLLVRDTVDPAPTAGLTSYLVTEGPISARSTVALMLKLAGFFQNTDILAERVSLWIDFSACRVRDQWLGNLYWKVHLDCEVHEPHYIDLRCGLELFVCFQALQAILDLAGKSLVLLVRQFRLLGRARSGASAASTTSPVSMGCPLPLKGSWKNACYFLLLFLWQLPRQLSLLSNFLLATLRFSIEAWKASDPFSKPNHRW